MSFGGGFGGGFGQQNKPTGFGGFGGSTTNTGSGRSTLHSLFTLDPLGISKY